MPVKKGDKVKVDYEGRLKDGTVFDSSEKHEQKLEFEVGASQVIKGFENAVIGMEKGQMKEIIIPVAEAYGDVNPQLIKKILKEQLPKDQEPQVGMVLVIKTPEGQQIPARITKVDEKDITVDLNHPLAGKELIFKITVLEVN